LVWVAEISRYDGLLMQSYSAFSRDLVLAFGIDLNDDAEPFAVTRNLNSKVA